MSVAGPLRILVVDDNVDAADMLAQILQIEGHAVALAYDAADGLASARRFRPDVAILDIGMPGMNGLDMARAMRRDAALAHTRLIALTGWSGQQHRQAARAAGFDVVLTKPAGIETLRPSLRPAASRD